MKSARCLILTQAMLFCAAIPALAHHDGDEIEHHWACSLYTQEMRLQMVWMVAAIVGVGAWIMLRRFRRSKRCGS